MTPQHLSLFFKANLLTTALLSLAFALFNSHYTASALVFTLAALLSTTATLYLVYWLLLRLFFRFTRVASVLLLLLFFLTDLLLMTDFAIYRIWNFHINGMVLNILFSPAAYDSLQMTGQAVAIVFLVIAALAALLLYTLKRIARIPAQRASQINRRLNRSLVPLLFLVILGEKLTYAVANLHLDGDILERTKVVPLYQPLLMDDLLIGTFGMEKAQNDGINVNIKKITNIRYPLHPISVTHPETPNIFIFGVDALRPDIVNDDNMPNMAAFKREAVDFERHYSGGNNTRFGFFSIFYGINSSYWFGFLNAKKGPVLFETLKKLGYQISIDSSVNTAWPEFRQTIFYDVQDAIKDDYNGTKTENDLATVSYFDDWLGKQEMDKPMFAFVWLDAVHSRAYDDAFRKYTPDRVGSQYLTATAEERTELFNMYKNAAYEVDDRFARFIAALKARGLYDDAVIIVLSDHGQEFFEHGHYGHNSAYDREQVGTPLYIRLPGTAPKKVTRLTSHLDIAPTLMAMLGADNPSSDYAHGHDLFAPGYHRECAFVGNWNENAIICDNETFVISDVISKAFNNEIRDTKSYEKIRLKEKKRMNEVLIRSLEENRQFSR